MKIKIYQINGDRDEAQIIFSSLALMQRLTGSREIDSRIYDKVYEEEAPCANLEEVYFRFNLDHPADYTGRSLSVSDVVEIVDPQGQAEMPPGFYFCDTIGFQKVPFRPEQAKDRETAKPMPQNFRSKARER